MNAKYFVGFQRKVIDLLLGIKEEMTRIGRRVEQPDSDFHLKKCSTLEDFLEQERALADPEFMRNTVSFVLLFVLFVKYMFV